VVASPYGHDGFLIETGAVAALLADLLEAAPGPASPPALTSAPAPLTPR
jgi:homoserine O-acetyltransferase